MHGTIRKVGLAVAALTGAAVGGAAVAGAATSNSATTVPPSSAGKPPSALRDTPAPGTAAHEEHEKAVTGEAADKARAAAVKAAGGGGTAGDATTDYFGKGYEVTVTRSDGTKVEIHLDSSFDVMRPPGGPGGAPPPLAFGN